MQAAGWGMGREGCDVFIVDGGAFWHGVGDAITNRPSSRSIARYYAGDDREGAGGGVRMGGDGGADSSAVFSVGPECEVEPDFFAQDAMGAEAGGGLVCGSAVLEGEGRRGGEDGVAPGVIRFTPKQSGGRPRARAGACAAKGFLRLKVWRIRPLHVRREN